MQHIIDPGTNTAENQASKILEKLANVVNMGNCTLPRLFDDSIPDFWTTSVTLCSLLPEVASVSEHNELGSAVRKPTLSTVPAVRTACCAVNAPILGSRTERD